MNAEQIAGKELLYGDEVTKDSFEELELRLFKMGYRWIGSYAGYDGVRKYGAISFYADLDMQTTHRDSAFPAITVAELLAEPEPFRSVTELIPEQEMLHAGLGITDERSDELYQHLIDQEVSAEDYLAKELEAATSICTNINEVAYVTFMYANAYTKKAFFTDRIATINMLMGNGEE